MAFVGVDWLLLLVVGADVGGGVVRGRSLLLCWKKKLFSLDGDLQSLVGQPHQQTDAGVDARGPPIHSSAEGASFPPLLINLLTCYMVMLLQYCYHHCLFGAPVGNTGVGLLVIHDHHHPHSLVLIIFHQYGC